MEKNDQKVANVERGLSLFASSAKASANAIASSVARGSMPPDGALPQNAIDLIGAWARAGAPQ